MFTVRGVAARPGASSVVADLRDARDDLDQSAKSVGTERALVGTVSDGRWRVVLL
jgi:hypothetical protein